MGSWGPHPWQSDAPLDYFEGSLDPVYERTLAWFAEAPCEADYGYNSHADTTRAGCDLLIRLAPYWSRGGIHDLWARALLHMRMAAASPDRYPEWIAYDDALISALEAMVGGTVPVLIVPVSFQCVDPGF